MEPVVRYAILSLCILIIGLMPFFVIRLYLYTIKSHFLLSKTAQRMSLVTNLLSFILFLSMLIFYTSVSGFLSPTFYIVMVLSFILVLLIYKRLDMKVSEQIYIVSFTRPRSRMKLIQGLSSNHLTHISTKSTFTFLTHIKFLGLNDEDIEEIETEIKAVENIFISFKGIFAHILFALYVIILSLSFVSFIIFFNVLV